jgi:large subunit ribosomal protein L16
MTGKANRGNKIAYGEYGLVALEPCWMTSNQLESGRIAINRCFQRGGKVWINVFPNKPVTKKPADTRMGSGKGSPEYWVAVVKPGRVIFEVTANSEALMKKALKLAQYKLPIKTKIVSKEDLEKLDVTPEVKEAK